MGIEFREGPPTIGEMLLMNDMTDAYKAGDTNRSLKKGVMLLERRAENGDIYSEPFTSFSDLITACLKAMNLSNTDIPDAFSEWK